MDFRSLRRSGHWPTLLCAFLYFDTSFMIWVMLGALGNALADDFHLAPGQKGMMVAVPILAGAGMRLVLGLLTDRIGARRTALAGLLVTMLPLLLGWLWVSSFSQLLVVGVLQNLPSLILSQDQEFQTLAERAWDWGGGGGGGGGEKQGP